MQAIQSFDQLETFGRTRLSPSFFMRDFLHSEIASWHQLKNVPDHPEAAVRIGRLLCEKLLEPLQTTFGRIHIRSGYRSPAVNALGHDRQLTCASNASNFSAHIWDYSDVQGRYGATACIVLPWLVDHMAAGGRWTDMAWWIHDHLPYSSLYFFPKLAAFNINFHELPVRRIDSYAAPRGCLTKPGMLNHGGLHAPEYAGFPRLGHSPVARSLQHAAEVPRKTESGVLSEPARERSSQQTPRIFYRAVHLNNAWRKVSSHHSVDAAVNGKDGAIGLFERRARIDYEKHGEPVAVFVWEEGASEGIAILPATGAGDALCRIPVAMATLVEFEAAGYVDHAWLQKFAAAP